MEMPYGAVVQQAYVVNDIRAAAEKFNRAFGIGPFVHLPHIKLPDVLYRGQPAEMEFWRHCARPARSRSS